MDTISLVYQHLFTLGRMSFTPYSYNICVLNYRKPFFLTLGTMNHGFTFALPRVFARESTQPHLPVTITQTQEQTTVHPPPSPPITNYNMNTNHNTDIHPTSQPSNSNYDRNEDGLITLHHKGSSNFVLEQYCLPASDTTWADDDKCKFGRDCILTKTKLSNQGETNTAISPTVFTNCTQSSKKLNYDTIDLRFVRCFNKLCKTTNSNVAKCFHYICFQHMMATQPKDGMKVLEYEGPEDTIIKQIDKTVDINSIVNNIKKGNTKLIFPVCGKRCYNSIELTRSKKDIKSHSEYAAAQTWDNDGDETSKSSIDVLIEWLTTEENSTNYFGGVDTDGRTSSNRKETYHHRIRDYIKKENG